MGIPPCEVGAEDDEEAVEEVAFGAGGDVHLNFGIGALFEVSAAIISDTVTKLKPFSSRASSVFGIAATVEP